jgi:hypothetical protein
VLGVPAGPVKIAVLSPEPLAPTAAAGRGRRGDKGQQPPPPVDRSKWVKLPDKYADPLQSEVTTTVNPGTTTYNIELK